MTELEVKRIIVEKSFENLMLAGVKFLFFLGLFILFTVIVLFTLLLIFRCWVVVLSGSSVLLKRIGVALKMIPKETEKDNMPELSDVLRYSAGLPEHLRRKLILQYMDALSDHFVEKLGERTGIYLPKKNETFSDKIKRIWKTLTHTGYKYESTSTVLFLVLFFLPVSLVLTKAYVYIFSHWIVAAYKYLGKELLANTKEFIYYLNNFIFG